MPYVGKQKKFLPDEVGMKAVALDSAKTSSDIDCEGYNQISLLVDYTYGAGTSVTITWDVSEDSTTWFSLKSQSVSSGVATLSTLTHTLTGTADADFLVNLPLNYKLLRITVSCAGVPTTSDIASVTVRLGNI